MEDVEIPLCTRSAVFALAVVGCGRDPAAPTPPTTVSGSSSAPDATAAPTLKATAPTPQSPVNGVHLDTDRVTLSVANASATYEASTPLSYRFQVFDAADTMVYEVANVAAGSPGVTSHAVTAELDGDKTYSWRSRAEHEGQVGPWSSRASFISATMARDGYIRGNELYDPLVNGKTVGVVHGPVTLVPNVGVKLESQLSYISYELPVTLTEGEFSILVTDLPANTEGDKTKLFAMGQGYDDIVTNDRRMTVEKRGDPPGVIAWRFITHDDQVDTEGPDRVPYNFQASQTYFWKATWRNNRFNLTIKEGGVNGVTIYDHWQEL